MPENGRTREDWGGWEDEGGRGRVRGNWGQGGASGPAASGREQAVLNGRPSGPLQPAPPGLPLQPLWEGVFRPRDKVTQGTRRLREQGDLRNKEKPNLRVVGRRRESSGQVIRPDGCRDRG